MNLERRIRAIAGTFILLSLALAHWVDVRFAWFTAFVGANLLQSALTRWCLMEDILRKVGLDGGSGSCCGDAPVEKK
ncbi:MAG: DUF2892 domain-containing protein [Elusimicrobia bacterium]|nr:DUF2892 domain-containing protein [Elusimicrobiota bacterium]